MPATVKKISKMFVYAQIDGEKEQNSFELRNCEMAPLGENKQLYEWRYALEKGQCVDFQDAEKNWMTAEVLDIREEEYESEDESKIKIKKVHICPKGNK